MFGIETLGASSMKKQSEDYRFEDGASMKDKGF
jgi:hypothetical protein